MDLRLKKEVLQAAVSRVASVVPSSSPNQVEMTHILFTVSGSSLTLHGVNRFVSIRVDIKDCEIVSEGYGRFSVPASKLSAIVKNLNKESDVQILVENARCHIKSDRGSFILSILDGSSFPTFKLEDAGLVTSVPAKELISSMKLISFAMAAKDARQHLNAMLFDVNPTGTTLVATDGHRLSKAELGKLLVSDTPLSAIVGRDGVLEIIKQFSSVKEGGLTVSISQSFMSVSYEDVLIVARLVGGRFPKWQPVIPKNLNLNLEANKKELYDLFYRSTILSNQKFHGVELRLDTDRLSLIARNEEQEESVDSISANYKSAPVSMGINAKYMMEPLSACDDDLIKLSFESPDSALVFEFTSKEGIETSHIVMPMRL